MVCLADVVGGIRREKGGMPVASIVHLADDGVRQQALGEIIEEQVVWPLGAPGRGEVGPVRRVWLRVDGSDCLVVGADMVSRRVAPDILAALRLNYDALGDRD